MRIILEDILEDAEIVINGTVYNKEETHPNFFTVADVFMHYQGTQEWDGIIPTIQKWFYGSMVKTAWCATSMCWVLAQLGLRQYTLQGKSDNVFNLNTRLRDAVSHGRCDEKKIEDIKYGDIIIFSWDGNFRPDSSKHVTSAIKLDGDHIKCIGGNQSNGINVASYDIHKIYAVYRPHYEQGTLKSLEDLPSA